MESACWRCADVPASAMAKAMEAMLQSNGGEGEVEAADSEDEQVGAAAGVVAAGAIAAGANAQAQADDEDGEKGKSEGEELSGEDEEDDTEEGSSEDEDLELSEDDADEHKVDEEGQGEDGALFGEGAPASAKPATPAESRFRMEPPGWTGSSVLPPSSTLPAAVEPPSGPLPRAAAQATTKPAAAPAAGAAVPQTPATSGKTSTPPNLRSRRDASSTWAGVAPGARLMLKPGAARAPESCTVVWKADDAMSCTFDTAGSLRVVTSEKWVSNFNTPPSKFISAADDYSPDQRAVYPVLSTG